MSKLFDALTRSLLEKYPADWLNQLGLIHGEPGPEIRCQFIILARKDELTPDFHVLARKDELTPDFHVSLWESLMSGWLYSTSPDARSPCKNAA
jgi:hypothetical protein